jgi:hypothetical protein
MSKDLQTGAEGPIADATTREVFSRILAWQVGTSPIKV